jgi:poly-D-alanine transfer protein DltD
MHFSIKTWVEIDQIIYGNTIGRPSMIHYDIDQKNWYSNGWTTKSAKYSKLNILIIGTIDRQ